MNTAASTPDGSGWYEICLQGRLDRRWAAYFEGMTLTTGDGSTLLEGQVVDQAALHGLLQRLRDLGLPLVSIRKVDTDGTLRSPHHPDSPTTGA
jgi:hypothetical protein